MNRSWMGGSVYSCKECQRFNCICSKVQLMPPVFCGQRGSKRIQFNTCPVEWMRCLTAADIANAQAREDEMWS